MRPAAKQRRWSVYLLRCADGTLYAGATVELARRVAAHDAGRGAKYTRSRRPVRLVWSRKAKDRSAALRLEARIKRLPKSEKEKMVAAAR